MTWSDLARLLERRDAAAEPTELGSVAMLALLLVLLLAAGFSTARQWSADGLRPPQQIATAED